MKTKVSYYLILIVYISLWTCQMVASHMTHSLIILTDSYINLYRILDISLGLLHLTTQTQLRRARKTEQPECKKQNDSLAGRIFDRMCTYQYKRLPVLGSFVNRLFLAALLMSAAIEGIQTCFHASHSSLDHQSSLFERYRYAYPAILVAFALVGIVMQWCSNLAHSMREEELDSESLLDVDENRVNVLDAQRLREVADRADNQRQQVSEEARKRFTLPPSMQSSHEKVSKNRYSFEPKRHQSFESIPLESDDHNKIFLTSLKTHNSLDNSIHSISKNVDLEIEAIKISRSKFDKWLIVRYCISPVALISCALIVCFVSDELIKEVADGFLAVLVVALLFTASYPPMKEASKVLLQSAPDDVDLDRLRSSILSTSSLIIQVKELAVWSLTSKSNRVATCVIALDSKQINSETQVSILLRDVRGKFTEQNIKCTTVQPIFETDSR